MSLSWHAMTFLAAHTAGGSTSERFWVKGPLQLPRGPAAAARAEPRCGRRSQSTPLHFASWWAALLLLLRSMRFTFRPTALPPYSCSRSSVHPPERVGRDAASTDRHASEQKFSFSGSADVCANLVDKLPCDDAGGAAFCSVWLRRAGQLWRELEVGHFL